MAKPRILLADSHPAILNSLSDLLAEGLGEVVGAVTDGEALVEAAQRLKPDIVFVDISMPRMNGLDATRTLRICAPQSKVIILTGYQEPAYVTVAFNAGACGYIVKRMALYEELSEALMKVLAGERYVGRGVREGWSLRDGDEASRRAPER